jgi:hypothetical protein
MRRFLFAFALALWAVAPVSAEMREEPGLVRLAAPRSGESLVAGSMAELEWAPLAPFARLADAEEWEAFLSLDGGATYPVRITPHLDLDLRRVRWQVPALPTADARLLLRFGDERRETYVQLPQRFAIAAAPWEAPVLDEPAGISLSNGEPALPGQAGVVAWVEGSRRGGSLRAVAASMPASLAESVRTPAPHGEPAVLAGETAPDGPPPSAAARVALAAPTPRRSPRAAGAGPALPALDILLLTQRRNE